VRFATSHAALPPNQRDDAISSAERFFLAMLLQFGHIEEDAKQWEVMVTGALRYLVLEYSGKSIDENARS
jgi:hypothetical protein